MLAKNAERMRRTMSRPNDRPKEASSFKKSGPPVTKDEVRVAEF